MPENQQHRHLNISALVYDGKLEELKALPLAALAQETYFWSAACGGHLPILAWLHESGIDLRAQTDPAARGAARAGQTHILQWLHDKKLITPKGMKAVLDNAANHKHIPVLQWMRDNGQDISALTDYTYEPEIRKFVQKMRDERCTAVVNDAIAELRHPKPAARSFLRRLIPNGP